MDSLLTSVATEDVVSIVISLVDDKAWEKAWVTVSEIRNIQRRKEISLLLLDLMVQANEWEVVEMIAYKIDNIQIATEVFNVLHIRWHKLGEISRVM